MSDFSRFSSTLADAEHARGDVGFRTLRVPPSLLPKHLRPHLTVFHRFVQLGHRVTDDPDIEPEIKFAFLDALERALTTGQERSPQVRPAIELRRSLIATGVTDAHARQILRAFRRDAAGERCRTWNELFSHCRLSAGPMGRYLLDLHGEGDGLGAAFDQLFTAMRLLGHLQSARSDWIKLGRSRLPDAWFDEAGVSIERLVETRTDPVLRGIFDRLLDHVDRLLDEVAGLPRRIRHRTLRVETTVMLEHARTLSRLLRRRDPLRRRVGLGPHLRLLATLRGMIEGMRNR
jgi:hydroxysqualene synthase